jgi:curved DNA-binding protein CbpA
MYSSFYEILNVPENTSIEEIKASFRKLALIHHPDKNDNSPESKEQFIIIYEAYRVLADPLKKEEYDTYLKTSSVLKGQKKGGRAPEQSKASSTLPGSSYDSLNTVFSHLNFLLWDIEDLLRRMRVIAWAREYADGNNIDWIREYSGKPLGQHILEMLIFIDRWALYPAGYRDYFLEARKKGKSDFANDIYKIDVVIKNSGHRPFVNIQDYFYNIRKRMDKLMKFTRTRDLVKTLPDSKIRLIDCIFEVQKHTIHYLNFLNQALSDEVTSFPQFKYSHSFFLDTSF